MRVTFSPWWDKPKPKQLLRPITTETNSSMNQSQFLAITCNSLEAREKSRVHGAIGFGFASHWLKNWRDSFKPITKRSNHNHVITFDGHLKTALTKLTFRTLSKLLHALSLTRWAKSTWLWAVFLHKIWMVFAIVLDSSLLRAFVCIIFIVSANYNKTAALSASFCLF